MEMRKAAETVLSSLPRPIGTWALFLDVDGTLLDIAPTPDGVGVPTELRQTLSALHHGLNGAIALVSGRSLDQLDRLFAPNSLTAAGQHGAEMRLANGSQVRTEISRSLLDQLRGQLGNFTARIPGVIIEDKGLSIAFHYRLAPRRSAAIHRQLIDALGRQRAEFRILRGNMVYEIVPKLADKGTAIESFMKMDPFIGRTPIFIGDDVTDEDGFASVRKLQGYAVRVQSEPVQLGSKIVSAASVVRGWLATLPDAIAREQGNFTN
ncbi:MAG: trehalose-phosphatase [Proteobacteria bacterium]|nr:trehalose-phosphatase [Pseudomonadota bacterium]